MATAKMYGKARRALWAAGVDWVNDATIKGMLCLSGYTPDQDAHQFKSDVTNELSTVATTLSSPSIVTATTISVAASIPVGNRITIDTAGNAEVRDVTAVTGSGPYTLTVAALNNAHAAAVTVRASVGYTTRGKALTNKTLLPFDTGTNVQGMDADDLTWAAASLSWWRVVLYKDTGVDATSVLLGYYDNAAARISEAGTTGVTWDPTGVFTDTVA